MFQQDWHVLAQQSEQQLADWLIRVQTSRTAAEAEDTREERQLVVAQQAQFRQFFNSNGRRR
jgi:hypothetical protein